jgi:Flp pilus assembly protein TadG
MSAFTAQKFFGFKSNTEGSAAPAFGLMVVPVLMAVGLAVDFSRAANIHTDMQNALDAASIAALKAGPSKATAAGNAIFNANFNQPLNGDVILNFTYVNGGGIKGTARGAIPLTSAAIFGYETVDISTVSIIEPEATITETTTGEVVVAGNIPCIHVMDQGNQYAFDLQDNEYLDASTCDARVRSNRSAAMREEDGDLVKFKRIDVKGQASVSNALQIMQSPYAVNEDAQIVGNPYEPSIRDVVQALPVGNCTNANTDKTWTGNVNPGTYCGRAEFKDATFRPGVYIIKSSTGNKTGDLRMSGNLNGSAGVTFYFADNKSKFTSYAGKDGTVLKAPTTGTTRGILFFESSNRGNAWALNIQTCKTHTWQGLVYLPSANVTLKSMEDWPMFNVSMSANTLLIEDSDNFTWEAYAWTPFNKSSPVRYSDETETQTVETTRDRSIYVRE